MAAGAKREEFCQAGNRRGNPSLNPAGFCSLFLDGEEKLFREEEHDCTVRGKMAYRSVFVFLHFLFCPDQRCGGAEFNSMPEVPFSGILAR